MKTILRSNQITKEYKNQGQILGGISLEIEEETFTAVLGPSGSGKSTLLNIMSGLTRPTSGEVIYQESSIHQLSERKLAEWKRREVSNVFQNYLLLNNLNVEENIRIGICPGKDHLPFDRLVGILDIEDILYKFPAQLSGGQQQRAAIARAVIKRPGILFCDEATGSLDEANSKNVVALLHDLKVKFGITVLFTTHNVQIARTADRILTIRDGRVSKDETNVDPISAENMVWG